MTAAQFLSIVKHGLPGCRFEQIYIEQMVCRVIYGGQRFDISSGILDGYPLFVVTSPEGTFNDATGAVLSRLDSIAEEFIEQEKPWADYKTLLERLREISEGMNDELEG
jgi:hypothetical protein